MKHLLDVNALIACEHQGSPHHAAFHAWARREGMANLATCCLTELGFIRVSMQVFGYSLPEAQTSLHAIKSSLGAYLADTPSPLLPAWASTPAKTTDGYLVQLAEAHGLNLATFDNGIPGVTSIR